MSPDDVPAANIEITIGESLPFKHRSWRNWAVCTARKIANHLVDGGSGSSRVDSVRVVGVTRVKSYGPRVSHLVLDLECRPGGG